MSGHQVHQAQHAQLRAVAKTLRWTRRMTMIMVGFDIALLIIYLWKL
ncbi:MAG TPA: hypothetical protein PLF40_21500 [Kofleriaceae bacterium]|nr:hypothetical protein [Kofleriaceae bacterium]